MSDSKYFPPYSTPNIDNFKVELDLRGCATKKDLYNISHVDTSFFALKTNLTALKTEVDKLDIPKLSTVPTDLSKLTKEVQQDFTKKTEFNKLGKKVTYNKTEQDSLETTVQNNHLTTETSINDLKTKVDDIDLTK